MLSFLKTNSKIGPGFFFICFFFLAAAFCQAGENVGLKGIVASFQLNVRTEPSQFSKVLMTLEKGDQVDIVGEKTAYSDWLTVEFEGKQGYIRNRPQYITLAKGTKTLTPREAQTRLDKNNPRKEQKAIATQIESQEKEVADFLRKESVVIQGLNETDYALNQARLKAAALSQETRELADKIKKIQESRDILARQIDEKQLYAGQRFNALYRMGMIGRLEVAGLPASMFDFFLTQNAMKQIIQSDLQVLGNQTQNLEKMNQLEMELGGQVAAKKSLEDELELQVRAREKETSKKEAILAEIQREKKLSQAALESLKASARELDEKLTLLEKDSLSSGGDSSFLLQKGKLIFPVKGSVISFFGSSKIGDYKSFTFQSGIDIKAERGEPVRAVFKGEVMFAQWLMGYGNLMIINHGDNYYTLYAHVEEVFKHKGEAVDTGEVIATAGDTGSIRGLRLHFEVRHHGKPVNPMQWLKKGA